ncbi:hypothetical protein [Nostoc sphaeroides]|uniref:RiboL-PSP-HEPN domain-containing protein n=1 Tax=Nostoc sphaeroides CCNUC1 TaxID=2653204 RepID=A0A5P8WJ48_9NOSO|nr:hypothetical protein [Nostoc sphaeroides]QFS52873.1 hypothetical protein GXM_10137 [Nostoc sphaeroides CCNUC1]
MKTRGSFPTSNYNTAYIARAWGMHKELEEREKRGFYQFFYLTICGHIESILSSVINARLDSINWLLQWDKIPPANYNENNITSLCDQKTVVESLLKIISAFENETENAPLGKLIDLHNKIFNKKLSELIGKELYEDLNAVASLRNLFAHGRNLFVEFKFDAPLTDGEVTLDYNPLKKAFDRLLRAGIINNPSNFNLQNYGDFLVSFYNDDAFLYFYRAIQEVEEKLDNSIEFPPERAKRFFVRLPDLEG